MPPARRAPIATGLIRLAARRLWLLARHRHARGFVAAVIAMLLFSCAAPPPRGAPVTALSRAHPHSSVGQPPAVSTTELSRGIRDVPWAREDQPLQVIPPPPPDRVTAQPEWAALTDWARSQNLAVPIQLIAAANAWEIIGFNGPLQIPAGSRQALFDGAYLWLGHSPRPGPAGPLVHRVDLEKNVRPLVTLQTLPQAGSRKIVLDPGHGGQSGGTRSVLDQRPEKDFVLDWALRLAPLLTAAGWEVFLTRTNDVDLTIAQRVAMTDTVRPDLFLSLHFNSAGSDLTQSGVETYCLTPKGLPSTLTRNYRDDPMATLPNNAHDEANLQYAARLHRALLRGTGAVDRGIRRARFMAVLLGQNCPAVLIEGGFLSHPREAARIATPAYRQLLAECVATALSDVSSGRPGSVHHTLNSPGTVTHTPSVPLRRRMPGGQVRRDRAVHSSPSPGGTS